MFVVLCSQMLILPQCDSFLFVAIETWHSFVAFDGIQETWLIIFQSCISLDGRQIQA